MRPISTPELPSAESIRLCYLFCLSVKFLWSKTRIRSTRRALLPKRPTVLPSFSTHMPRTNIWEPPLKTSPNSKCSSRRWTVNLVHAGRTCRAGIPCASLFQVCALRILSFEENSFMKKTSFFQNFHIFFINFVTYPPFFPPSRAHRQTNHHYRLIEHNQIEPENKYQKNWTYESYTKLRKTPNFLHIPAGDTERPILLLAAGGRPSTWSPPGRLVEHHFNTKSLSNNAKSSHKHSTDISDYFWTIQDFF